MLKKEDLLQFSKNVELVINLVEDDSSDRTEVKVLHLVNPVTASGSIPTSEGLEMKATSNKVYVAADDITEFLNDAESKDGAIHYKGQMHLDVSKPAGRRDANGDYVITKPAKIWLTKTKFSRSGGQLRTDSQQSLNTLINKMFSGKPLDLTAPENAAVVANAAAGGAGGGTGTKKAEPVVTKTGP